MKKYSILMLAIFSLFIQQISANNEKNILTTKMYGTTIVIKQSNIVQEKNRDAIVNAANFDLAHGGGVAGALRKADPEWNSYCIKNIDHFKKNGFKDGGLRAVITPAFQLQKNGILHIINAVGPQGDDPQWENKLYQTYEDTLTISNKHAVSSIVFSPISAGIFAKNTKGKVEITPSKAAKIAISAITDFLKKNKKHQLYTIEFTSIESDGPVHFFAYKKALGFTLSDEEQKIAQKAEKEYIDRLEK